MTEREKPLGLDMDPDEAFARFLGVKPEELPPEVLLRQKKGPQKRPPGVDDAPAPAKGRAAKKPD